MERLDCRLDFWRGLSRCYWTPKCSIHGGSIHGGEFPFSYYLIIPSVAIGSYLGRHPFRPRYEVPSAYLRCDWRMAKGGRHGGWNSAGAGGTARAVRYGTGTGYRNITSLWTRDAHTHVATNSWYMTIDRLFICHEPAISSPLIEGARIPYCTPHFHLCTTRLLYAIVERLYTPYPYPCWLGGATPALMLRINAMRELVLCIASRSQHRYEVICCDPSPSVPITVISSPSLTSYHCSVSYLGLSMRLLWLSTTSEWCG